MMLLFHIFIIFYFDLKISTKNSFVYVNKAQE